MTTIDARTGQIAGPLEEQAPYQRYKQAHHYRSKEEEFDACKLGMWLFLTTEVLLFGGIFCSYAIFRMLYPNAFSVGSSYLDWRWGGINTIVLLVSSYTMAVSIHYAQLNDRRKLQMNLLITIVLGLTFVAVKLLLEYIPKWSGWFFVLDPSLSHYTSTESALGGLFRFVEGYGGKAPGMWFNYPFAEDPHENIWWSIYYSGTAIHATHVLIGCGLIFWIFLKARRGCYGPTHYTGVEIVGLYWHLVDLIWIFLFPLLYLIH